MTEYRCTRSCGGSLVFKPDPDWTQTRQRGEVVCLLCSKTWFILLAASDPENDRLIRPGDIPALAYSTSAGRWIPRKRYLAGAVGDMRLKERP